MFEQPLGLSSRSGGSGRSFTEVYTVLLGTMLQQRNKWSKTMQHWQKIVVKFNLKLHNSNWLSSETKKH